MGPIFNEKVAKKWNLWVHEQYIMHCLRQKSQHLQLLFIEQCMNSNHVLPKRVEKKKKKMQNANVGGKRGSKHTHTWKVPFSCNSLLKFAWYLPHLLRDDCYGIIFTS